MDDLWTVQILRCRCSIVPRKYWLEEKRMSCLIKLLFFPLTSQLEVNPSSGIKLQDQRLSTAWLLALLTSTSTVHCPTKFWYLYQELERALIVLASSSCAWVANNTNQPIGLSIFWASMSFATVVIVEPAKSFQTCDVFRPGYICLLAKLWAPKKT